MILTNSCKKVLNNFIQQYTIIENQRINLHALSMTDERRFNTDDLGIDAFLFAYGSTSGSNLDDKTKII